MTVYMFEDALMNINISTGPNQLVLSMLICEQDALNKLLQRILSRCPDIICSIFKHNKSHMQQKQSECRNSRHNKSHMAADQ